jgi:hypothetical protein
MVRRGAQSVLSAPPPLKFGILAQPRRANQAHIDIVTEIIEPAPRDRQRVFHFHAAKFAKSVSIRTIDFAAF